MLQWVGRIGDWLRQSARARQWHPSKALGRQGEDLAHRYLQDRGMRVVARNYRTPNGNGEVDLVAWEKDVLVFVEVKTRTTDEFGAPDRAIDREKMAHLRRAASHYARRSQVDWSQVRFDTVSVVMRDPVEIVHIRDAFSVNGWQ